MKRVFHPVRWSAPASVGFGVGLGSFCTYAGIVLIGRGDPLGIVFFGVAAAAAWATGAWLVRWRWSKPAIEVSDDGILDGTALGRPRFIPWDDIESVSVAQGSTTLVLREGSSTTISFHRRFLGRLTGASGRAYVLPTALLDAPAPVVGSLIEQHHEARQLDAVRRARALESWT